MSRAIISIFVDTDYRILLIIKNAVSGFFRRLYRSLGFEGCSSHSGRRTFITSCDRKVSQAGGSIRDVIMLAGHRNLATTQGYIDHDEQA